MSHPKLARADHDILEVIRRRWSPRAFDETRDVTRADLLRLFEAARWAPSSMNEQPWRFVVGQRSTSPETHAALLASLTGRNPHWAASAPVLVLLAVRKMLEQFEAENRAACYDAGQAVGFLALQATSMGLSIRQMEGFDRDRARAACRVPPEFDPVVMIAIGYAGRPEALAYEKHRVAEQAPRERRPLSETVFEGTWDRPY